MKLVIISDTHMRHRRMTIPDGDVLVHCGDATMRGDMEEILPFGRWISGLPHKRKIFIPGNHDWLFASNENLARSLMPETVDCLIDESVTINDVKFYGSPWQPRFFDWAFNVDRGQKIAKKWALIPNDTQVLITHGPPHGILDKVKVRPGSGRDPNVGCMDLLTRIEELQDLRLHAFGHIHEGYGQSGIFVNASCVDESYERINAPIVVDI